MQKRQPRLLAVVFAFDLPGWTSAAAQRPFAGGSTVIRADSNGVAHGASFETNRNTLVSKASKLLASFLAQGQAAASEGGDARVADGRGGELAEEIARQGKLTALMVTQALGSRQDEIEALVTQEAQTVRAQEKAMEAMVLHQLPVGPHMGLNWSTISGMEPHSFSMPVSCYAFASPCGNLVLGDAPVDIRTPFGSFVLHGGNETRQDVEKIDKRFSEFIFWGCWAGAALVIAYYALNPKKVRTEWRNILEGKLTPVDEYASQQELLDELEKRKNPTALYFIAPGNVYRLLAIMHPGVIGWHGYRVLAFQAMICSFMQFYLPFCFTKSVLTHWEVAGVKSPFWYMESPVEIMAMMGLIAALSLVMGGRIREHMVVGAEANFYILTHHKPSGEEELANMAADSSEAGQGLSQARRRSKAAKVDERFIDRNELFWCTASTLLDIVVSLLSQVIFIMEVGTCAIDDVEKIVTISIALIFIFEIDDKMMDIDPRNRTRYRREVLRSTEEDDTDAQPVWIKSIAAIAVLVSWLVNIIGVLGYIFIRWRNRETGYEIGAAHLSSLGP
jgi:hypothetical protein